MKLPLPLWQAVLIILATSILTFSCKKDGGLLPEYDLNAPYYEDLEFEDLWSLDLTHLDFPGGLYLSKIKLAGENILISYDQDVGILAINVLTGEILWHLQSNSGYEIAYNSDFISLPDRLVFFDRLGITSVDIFTGQVMSTATYSQIDGITGFATTFTTDERDIFALTFQGATESGIQRLYKINPVTLESQLLVQLDVIITNNNNGNIYLDRINNKIYSLTATGFILSPNLILAEVNLNDNSHIIHEINEHASLGLHTLAKQISVHNNIVYLPSQFSNDLVAFDLESGSDLGILSSVKQVEPYGSKIIALNPTLGLFDPESFQFNWKTSGSHSYSLDFTDINPDDQVIVFAHSITIGLISISDGQLLMRQALEADNNNRYYSSNLVVSRKHNLIFRAGFDVENNHGIIRCIQSTIDL